MVDALGAPPRKLRVGIGDDAAAWKVDSHHLSLLTTDMLLDGVHFRLAETTASALGHKALAQNLSDIAAMGGWPTVAVIALGLTPAVDETWVREFYRGVAALAKSARCAIAGGDIVRAPALIISVTVAGEVRRTRMRLRSGARARRRRRDRPARPRGGGLEDARRRRGSRDRRGIARGRPRRLLHAAAAPGRRPLPGIAALGARVDGHIGWVVHRRDSDGQSIQA